MIFPRINLPNFAQFKQYYGKSVPRVLLLKARFFTIYCELFGGNRKHPALAMEWTSLDGGPIGKLNVRGFPV